MAARCGMSSQPSKMLIPECPWMYVTRLSYFFDNNRLKHYNYPIIGYTPKSISNLHY